MIHLAHLSTSMPHLFLGATSPTLWYLTRATALSAYLVLTLSVILGMLRGIARTAHERLSWMVDELHQVAATVMVCLMAAHLMTLNLDPFLPFSIVNLVLPVNEPYRPTAVDLGVLAMYGVVTVALTSWLRRFLSHRAWRRVHYLSFVAFALVTAHGWMSGSDTSEPWMRAVYAASAASVVFLAFMRIFAGAPRTSSAVS